MTKNHYDVIIVGAGHAGVEAAWAAAHLGLDVALVTMSLDTIAQMSCNPAIGGLAKGQIVREIDALGGLMGLAIDQAGIQFRMLNRSKGPAVWAPRAQADKWYYQDVVRSLLSKCKNLTILADTADELLIENGKVNGLLCKSSTVIEANAVVLTTGTFLRGLMHIGSDLQEGGRYGEPSANKLSLNLKQLGLQIQRLKTGTPPRIDADTIDYEKLTAQPGDPDPTPFSFMNDTIEQKQISCWITYTNPKTHKIIQKNLDRAPLYTGQIQSIGPRYCPSIETKISRFADKDRHQMFLEPEGRDSKWIYCNGISTSLPRDVQDDLVHSIDGLENAKILRYGYAIEYDYICPFEIRATLETKKIPGLFLAGQINGTSGYEEAAGQGLIAGINAARSTQNRPLVTLSREQAYIGVMIDDLVTKGIDEPYRMFTSRAEYRLLLRSDNADQRLTPLARKWHLADDKRWARFERKHNQIKELEEYLRNRRLNGKSLSQLLCHQQKDLSWLLEADKQLAEKNFDISALIPVVNDIKYAGYIEKQMRLIDRHRRAEHRPIPRDFDYRRITQLRKEAQEKLNLIRPMTLGQAGRISGINPADITVLMISMERDGLTGP